MSKVKFFLGTAWSAPITLLCYLFYVFPFLMLGWYHSLGFHDVGWVYVMNEAKAPDWLKKRWARWAGHAMGQLVVLKKFEEGSKYYETVLAHEMVHVRQCMLLGVFQPIVYGLCILAGKVLQKFIGDYDAYLDNMFEVHARRHAGQVVDVVGYTKKLQAQKNLKKTSDTSTP